MTSHLAAWMFGLLVLGIGVANLLLVHPVPAVAYALVSLVYFPPASAALKARFGISIHPVARVVLGIIVVMFTLGVSDLGDMIDDGMLDDGMLDDGMLEDGMLEDGMID